MRPFGEHFGHDFAKIDVIFSRVGACGAQVAHRSPADAVSDTLSRIRSPQITLALIEKVTLSLECCTSVHSDVLHGCVCDKKWSFKQLRSKAMLDQFIVQFWSPSTLKNDALAYTAHASSKFHTFHKNPIKNEVPNRSKM